MRHVITGPICSDHVVAERMAIAAYLFSKDKDETVRVGNNHRDCIYAVDSDDHIKWTVPFEKDIDRNQATMFCMVISQKVKIGPVESWGATRIYRDYDEVEFVPYITIKE